MYTFENIAGKGKYIPGNISLRLAGGLLVSRVSLWLAVLTGITGLMINLSGSLIVAVQILIAPTKENI